MITILGIDIQNDFVDKKIGTLVVPGAEKDTVRLANLINRKRGEIVDIILTMDKHQRYHIAHKIFWTDKNGLHPNEFTEISNEDVKIHAWAPVDKSIYEYSKFYTEQLEKSKNFKLMIWPEHCIEGTVGQALVPALVHSVHGWEGSSKRAVIYTKGEHPLTEQYSAITPEVVSDEYKTNYYNMDIIDRIKNNLNEYNSKLLIAGQALSHCVAETVEHISSHLTQAQLEKCYILTDASSPVAGFETQAADFLQRMQLKGMNISKTTQFV